MKSPIYGRHRGNSKQEGKGYHASGGNVHMKGKLSKRMSCGCCTCLDLRQRMINKIHKQDIIDSQSGHRDHDATSE